MTETSLVYYDNAKKALALVHRVDQIKSVRDKAEAMQLYAKQAKDSASAHDAKPAKPNRFRNGCCSPRQPCPRHGEIAKRYARQNEQRRERNGKSKAPFNVAPKRVEELNRLFAWRYGGEDYVLPDDDAGRDDAYVMCCHLARCPNAPPIIRRRWLAKHAPWLTPKEVDRLLQRRVLKWKADKLAQRVGLTHAVRQRLGIRTIGAIDKTREERKVMARQLRTDRERARRRAKGVKPRAEYRASLATSASQAKPWEAFGWCRRTWERHGKPEPTSDNVARSETHIEEQSSSLQSTDLATRRKPPRPACPKTATPKAKATRKPLLPEVVADDAAIGELVAYARRNANGQWVTVWCDADATAATLH